ncbi:MAG: TIGR04282 family arsenosugar biosynthesis glycosyltransferase [Gammaproteobacteria bacterium]|nr:TIGR04282 family arsenosugar biosynthesis glycosyltransferase [Gammaproteobacteria bacterium]
MIESGRPSCCLVVMAKAPVPGRVKTRLIPGLGTRRATDVYLQLLSNTVRRLTAVDGQRVLSCDPDTGHVMFRRLGKALGWQRIPQARGDLGYRMSSIISRFQRHYDYTIVMGSDLANLNAGIVKLCLDQLIAGHDIVLGATEDGGYGLIGMSRLHAAVFRNIPWSSDRVLGVTLARCRQLHLNVSVVGGLWDVDNYQDYRRWRRL